MASGLPAAEAVRSLRPPVFYRRTGPFLRAVQAKDGEAVTFACKVATEFRQTFKRDVVIELVCYRRHGHNEADEPAATQPVMYQVINNLPTTRALYADRLLKQGTIPAGEAEALVNAYRQDLDAGHSVDKVCELKATYGGNARSLNNNADFSDPC